MSNYTIENISDSTRNVTDQHGNSDPFHNIFVQLIFSILYIIIFFMGMYGNFLVCFVVLRNKTMQTVTNFFITNLALADMLLCLFCVTLTPTYTILQKWIFGEFLCHTVAFLQCFCVYLSTLTLTSIAIDRFFVIVYPFRPRMKVYTCLLILLLIWISSCLLTAPYGYYMEVKNHEETLICDEDWPTEDIRKVFGAVTSILQFWSPFVIIFVCYLCIFMKLQTNKRRMKKARNLKGKSNEEKKSKKTSTNQMLALMVVIFGTCWLPLNIINLLEDFYVNWNETQYYTLLFFTSHLFAMSSVIYNPLIYAWLNENFRKEFKQILPCTFYYFTSHRELKAARNLQGSNSNRNEKTNSRNTEKTIQETTFFHQNSNENVDVLIENEEKLNNDVNCETKLCDEKEGVLNGNHT